MLLMLLMLLGVPGAAAGGGSTLSALEDKLAAATAQRETAEQTVKDAKSSYTDALAKKQAIDKKIYALNLEIDAILELIAVYETQISERDAEIAALSEKLEEQYQIVRERIRAKREDCEVDILTLLMETDGLTELFTQMDRYLRMLEYDKKLLDSYTEGIRELETLRTGLADSKAVLDTRMAQLETRRSELDADLAAANKLVASTSNQLSTAEADLERVAAIEAQYDEERKEKLAALQKTTNASYVGGEFLWPLPANYTTVSSGFGWRTHPVTGKAQFHNGIDIPAAYGTTIFACNDGTVVECSYNYADGYYVTVDHGGGVATFYSHVSKFRVSVGDKVKRGQVIANVGTSGYTTGAHLNLNVYKDGVSVNPMTYFQ